MAPPPVVGPAEGLNAAVAAQIRAEAAAAKLTEKALAEKAGLRYSSLRRWLGKDRGNERDINLAVLDALAEVLGVSPSEIVRRAQERRPAPGGGSQIDRHGARLGEVLQQMGEPTDTRSRMGDTAGKTDSEVG